MQTHSEFTQFRNTYTYIYLTIRTQIRLASDCLERSLTVA